MTAPGAGRLHGRLVQTLLFRCDANAETGLGHLARCRDLARLLRPRRPKLRVVFAGDFSEYGRRLLQEHAFEVIGIRGDEALLPERLGPAVGSEARLLVDSYRLELDALDALESWPAPWGVFDDFGRFGYQGGRLVINTRVGASAAGYRARHAAVGPSYFPATPELEQARARRPATAPGAPRSILVFIGGHDRYAVGPKLAQAAADCFAQARVTCVQDQPLPAGGARVVQRPLGPELSPLIAGADLVLSGGGRSKYEAMYCLAPCASLSQTAGQAEDTGELARRGLCVDLGACAGFDAARAAEQLRELWRADVLRAMRDAQAREFPADAGARLAREVSAALELA